MPINVKSIDAANAIWLASRCPPLPELWILFAYNARKKDWRYRGGFSTYSAAMKYVQDGLGSGIHATIIVHVPATQPT